MKKLGLFLIILLVSVGCSITSMKAYDAVEDYLNKYQNLDSELLSNLDELIKEENLEEDQKEIYRNIMKRQYKDLEYEIIEEEYNGNEAVVKTKIKVYDLYSTQVASAEHKEEYSDYNDYLDYKLESMLSTDKRAEYIINFKVVKENGNWVLDTLSTSDLEKIHGIYNYDI